MATDNVSQDVRDDCNRLTRKLSQLEAVLHGTYGDSREGFDSMADDVRENYMWACADLAGECKELAQRVSTAAHNRTMTTPETA